MRASLVFMTAIVARRCRRADIPAVKRNDLEVLLAAAEDAARSAGERIIKALPEQRSISASKANSKDLLTSTDVACQEAIREALRGRCPDVEFLGEEDVGPGSKASQVAARSVLGSNPRSLCWVVDPIDGTTNFVDGLPLSTVSIACVATGLPSETLVGVVYDPYRDELFAAAKGLGATLSNNALSVSSAATLGDAVIYAGAPPNPSSLAPSLRGIRALAPRVRTIRMLGSAALMLAYVAAGRGTAYFEPDLSAWDSAAGCLLIEEAGGRCTDAAGQSYDAANTRQIVASNGHIHSNLLGVLNEVDAATLDESDGQLLATS